MALDKSVSKSIIWKFMESFGSQSIQLIVSIVLARILLPSDYGVISLITIFISLAQIITTSGFSIALVRQKDVDETDYSTAYYTSLVISLVLYIILFFVAPIIADFYQKSILTKVLRVLSLIIILGAYNSIQLVVLQRKMLFRRLFISSFGAVCISGIVGILLAYLGYGVWALVAQQLVAVIVKIIVMSFTVKWHPRFLFSVKRLKVILKFGLLTLISSLLGTFFSNITGLIIGKVFTIEDLAFYNKGYGLSDIIAMNISNAFVSVMLPVLACNQDNVDIIKKIDKKTIITLSYILFPMLFGMIVCAGPLIDVVYTSKWNPAVPYLQAFCIINLWMPIIILNLQSLNAIGRSDKVLIIEIFKNTLSLIGIIISIRFGLFWLMVTKIIISVFSGMSNAYYSKKYFNYSIWEQLKDVLPSLFLSIIMFLIVYPINFSQVSNIVKLIIQVPVGIMVYIILSIITKNETYFEIIDKLKTKIRKIIGNDMRKRVYVVIKGGLGNQMFQYAFYKNLLKINCNVKYDIGFYNDVHEHNGFELDKIFNIDVNNMYVNEFNPSFMQKVLSKLKIKKYCFDDDSFSHVRTDVARLKNCILDGYWFEPSNRKNLSRDEIFEIFRFKNQLDEVNANLAKQIENSNSVSIHVRHGDYMKLQNIFKILDIQYYKDSMKFIESKIDNPKYFIFSDDMAWCKQHFKGDNFIFVDNNSGLDSYKDMQLMSLCKHNIIANSSFSIWGGILNQNKEKIVCAPKYYHNDSSKKLINWGSYGFITIDN